jgi:hypothetical protein
MIRRLLVLTALAAALAVRVVVDEDVRLDGSVVVPVLLLAAAVLEVARRAESGGAR